MAALYGRTEIGLKNTGSFVTVANNPKAKLMYYLNCISSVLDLNDEEELDILTNHRFYYRLTTQETDTLVALCYLLSPDVLAGKVMFQDDDMCGDSSNEFYELNALRTNMFLSESILIGGQTRTVKQIMFFKLSWIEYYWVEPMELFSMRLARIATVNLRARQPAVEYPSSNLTYTTAFSSTDILIIKIILATSIMVIVATIFVNAPPRN